MKHTAHILLSPRITEKGAYVATSGVYVFNIAQSANKHEVAAAVKEIYKVTPRKVTVLSTPRKERITRGTNRKGKSTGGKKAYVYLKPGETIELV